MLKAKVIITSLLEQQPTKKKSKLTRHEAPQEEPSAILTHKRTQVQVYGRGKGRVNPPQGKKDSNEVYEEMIAYIVMVLWDP